MSVYKINKDHTIEPTEDATEAWKSKEKYGRVGYDEINGSRISTIFLVIDHAYTGSPLLFETMIFGGKHDQYQDRYGSWDEAVKGHKHACKLVKESIGVKNDS